LGRGEVLGCREEKKKKEEGEREKEMGLLG